MASEAKPSQGRRPLEWDASSLSLLAMTLVLGLLFGMVSCKKSSGLSGAAPVAPGNVSSATSASGTSTGTVMGGLTPVSGATVSLFQAGTNTAIATTTTNAQGVFNLPFTGASGLLYYKATGGTPLGNPGGTSNSNIQMIGLVGSSSALPAGTIQINELTTAAFMTVAKLMGIVTDTSGTVTFSAPNNTATTNNIVTQINNLITNGQYASGLSTAQQQSLGTVANAIAGCVENSSSCSTLMSTATNPSGGGASSNILDAANNMLGTTSSTTIGNVFALAQKSAPTTGFALSGSAPSVLSAQLAATSNAYALGSGIRPYGIAVDSSGNLWIAGFGSNSILQVNPSGTVIGNFALPSSGARPMGLAIDASGNIWVGNRTAVVNEFNSSGSLVGGPFSTGAGNFPQGMGIDASGNVWVGSGSAGTNLAKLNSSGTVLGTFAPGTTATGLGIDGSGNIWVGDETSIAEVNSSGTTLQTVTLPGTAGATFSTAFDKSGNIWVTVQTPNQVEEISSSGKVLATFSLPTLPVGIAIDQAGNIWVAYSNTSNATGNAVTEISSSGVTLATFSIASGANMMAIDASGNVWVDNENITPYTLTELVGVAAGGGQSFPYTGPIFPFSNN